MEISQESGTVRGGRDCSNNGRISPSFAFKCKLRKKFRGGKDCSNIRRSSPSLQLKLKRKFRGRCRVEVSQQSGVARGGRECSNNRRISPSFEFECKRKRICRGGKDCSNIRSSILSFQLKICFLEEGAGWKYLKRSVLSEEGMNVVTLEGSVPPSNSNSNENVNIEEGSGENCVSLSP